MCHSEREPGRGKPAEPPVRLVLAMTVLGMLIGALIAPADADAAALGAWLKDLTTARAPADEP
ncbi:MAG: hypothetical protein SYC29_09250 [Planctomycetota bacterium]|nr:hypothetical protein [Planctomycetota bacterium]